MNSHSHYVRFGRQHTLAKLLFTTTGCVVIALSSSYNLLYLAGVLLLYYFLDASILRPIALTLVKLLPLFISLFVMGLLFAIPFPIQATLAARIALILSLSVYCLRTTPPQQIFHDAAPLLHIRFFHEAIVFFAATISFIPLFQDAYSSLPRSRSLLHTSITAVHRVFDQLSYIEEKVTAGSHDYVHPGSKPGYNLIALLASILLVIILCFGRN
jgi:hypothetical protein